MDSERGAAIFEIIWRQQTWPGVYIIITKQINKLRGVSLLSRDRDSSDVIVQWSKDNGVVQNILETHIEQNNHRHMAK